LSRTELNRSPRRRRGGRGDAHVTERVIGQFLAKMDGVEEFNGVLIPAASAPRTFSPEPARHRVAMRQSNESRTGQQGSEEPRRR
jgi:SpoVK/Ycf46/Vps4 family AAA+-type ATPase